MKQTILGTWHSLCWKSLKLKQWSLLCLDGHRARASCCSNANRDLHRNMQRSSELWWSCRLQKLAMSSFGHTAEAIRKHYGQQAPQRTIREISLRFPPVCCPVAGICPPHPWNAGIREARRQKLETVCSGLVDADVVGAVVTMLVRC